MKKLIILILGLLLIVFVSFASEEQMDFRNTKWGMSMKEVKEIETLKLMKSTSSTLIYQTRISGLDCFLVYGFHEDRLYTGTYIFQVEHLNYNKYIDDFMKLKELLEEKYGKYEGVVVFGDPDINLDKGIAVGMGYLKFHSMWELENTRIYLELYGENLEFDLFISYINPEIYSQMQQTHKNKILNDL